MLLQTRRGSLVQDRFPDLTTAARSLPHGLVLDGELAVLDPGGQLSFTVLQRRARPPAATPAPWQPRFPPTGCEGSCGPAGHDWETRMRTITELQPNITKWFDRDVWTRAVNDAGYAVYPPLTSARRDRQDARDD